jgi:hypothetical protein
MPVKFMNGLRNLYENYATAGFNRTEELHYCAETTLGKDVYASSVQCANIQWPLCNNVESDTLNCEKHVRCPKGHFVVMGACNTWGQTDTSDKEKTGYCSGFNEPDYCPYQCVPMGARHSIDYDLKSKDASVKVEAGDFCWDTAKKLADLLE